MKTIACYLILVLFLFTEMCNAQNGDNRKKFRNEIDSVMKQKLITNLQISDADADKLMNAFKENNKSVKSLAKERKGVMESIELDPSAADIETKLDKLSGIDTQLIELRQNFYRNLKTFLTPQQIAKTFVIKKNFNRELKQQLRKRGNRNKQNKPDNQNNQNNQFNRNEDNGTDK
ncbi:MAG: hypothetical protein JNJ56_14710 [Ignavibacteria bacterium]|nr:hypothetical protein [Ignavibacteria bacterium]